MRLLDQWAYDNRQEIDRGIYLTDEIVKNIVKVNPNPMCVAATTSDPSDKIFSNLMCLPLKHGQRENVMIPEKIARETEHNRNVREAEKLSTKSNTRAPPTTYARLKANIAITQGLTEICFGKKCKIVQGLESLYKQLD